MLRTNLRMCSLPRLLIEAICDESNEVSCSDLLAPSRWRSFRNYCHLKDPAAFRLSHAIAMIVVALFVSGIFTARAADALPELSGRLVAVGIPGIGGVTAVGVFHPGGPIHDKPSFCAFTQPGAVLDPERLLIASSSNFGAPVGNTAQPPGSVLSIDPRDGPTLVIPPEFGAAGCQASAVAGRVLLFTANSPAFLNSTYNPNALTANFPAVANPTAISINNAFGRIWVTSMPFGPRGNGSHSILDPDGRPLEGAPDKEAGGVFSSSVTNRVPQLIEGSMASGALATTLLGKSPDGSGRAVFAGLHADGSLVQVHTERGVDGLAPAGTITPLRADARSVRAGMTFNWIPNMILYVTDPVGSSIVSISLRADGKTFRVESTHRLASPKLNMPVDIAPAIPELGSSIFSSNKTLAGDADFYVANRGDGTIVRLKQNGTAVASRRITLPGVGPIAADRLNGIAVSSDAARIWITVSGKLPGYPEGALIEVSAFGAPNGSRRE